MSVFGQFHVLLPCGQRAASEGSIERMGVKTGFRPAIVNGDEHNDVFGLRVTHQILKSIEVGWIELAQVERARIGRAGPRP